MNTKYLIPLLCLILFALACSNTKHQKELELSCDSIAKLMDRDQNLRSTKLMNPFFANVDSLMKVVGYEGGLDDISYLNDEERDSIWSLARAEIKPFTERQKSLRDSLWKVQRELDSLNTLLVINQIQTFGIDSVNRIDQKCGHNSLVVFVHAPPGLFSEVDSIINQNVEKIGENRIQQINWHIKGRKDPN